MYCDKNNEAAAETTVVDPMKLLIRVGLIDQFDAVPSAVAETCAKHASLSK